MAAYYNENEPYAAAWLRNLIAEKLIAPGDVDERSILDVQPDDLIGYEQCHFFAGIGGWSLAARQAGWPDDRPLWSASCPCQPFSVAGKGEGQKDERHLWPIFFRLFRARRPAFLVGEQVAAAIGKDWLDGVHADLEGIGYASRAVVVPACAINAPHRRDRLWFVASPLAVADSVTERQGNPFGGGRYDRDRTGQEPGLGSACDGDVADATGGFGTDQCIGDGSSGQHVRDEHGAGGGDHLRNRAQGDSETATGNGAALGVFGDVADAIQERCDSGDAQRRGRPGVVPGATGEVEGQLPQLATAPDHRQGNVFDGGDVADATSERSQGRAPSEQRQQATGIGPFSSGPGELHDVDDAFGARLEGLAGHGSDGREPGWLDADAARPVAATGGALSDADLTGSGAEREQRSRELGGLGGHTVHRHWDAAVWIVGADGKARRVGARLRSVADGLPDDVAGVCSGSHAEFEIETIPLLAHGVKARVGKLRAFGNAIVPELAAEVIGAYLDTHP